MKTIKVMWNGKHLRNIYPHATKWQVFKFKVKRFLRKVLFVTGFAGVIMLAVIIGGKVNPKVVVNTVEAIKEVDSPSPVLARIAGCESGTGAKSTGSQFDKNGQVMLRSNNNRSVDVGKYQINTVWFAKASELGFDLTTEQGNEAMALWIYKNRGTGEWSASVNCWR